MKERLLLYFKKNVPFIWSGIELLNSFLIWVLHNRKLKSIAKEYAAMQDRQGLDSRMLNLQDLDLLHAFLSDLKKDDYTFFQPHGFGKKDLKKVLGKNLYLTFGVFQDKQLVGYCFLRLFFNKAAFLGRILHPSLQRKGIGKKMARLLLEVSAKIGFTTYGTVSRDNTASLKSHEGNKNMEFVKNLDKGYMLVKFTEPKNSD